MEHKGNLCSKFSVKCSNRWDMRRVDITGFYTINDGIYIVDLRIIAGTMVNDRRSNPAS